MEGYKHFSHTHNLNHHQVPQGTQITCSGCNSTAIGTVYVCWKCNFFLHENCYHATRSLQHPSHPSHPLTLVPFPTYPSTSFYCNACTLVGTGFSYTCSHCEFDLHIQCAYSNSSQQNFKPNQNYTMRVQSSDSGEILHKSHLNHPLTLLSPPPYKGKKFTCNACYEEGSGSTYHCSTCKFDLHVECASLTEVVKREDHQHPLQLTFSCPTLAKGGIFECDVCCVEISNNNFWIYYCKTCDFGCHTKCANSKACDAEELADRLAAAKIAARIEDEGREAALDLWDPPGTKYKYKYKHDDIW